VYNVLIKLSPGKKDETLAYVEKIFKTYSPQYPYEYSFLNDEYIGSYSSERKMAKIIIYFTYLSIFISALGLFGLAAFMAERRTKEIGIRKVTGASVSSLVLMLTKDFTKYVVIGFIPACLVAGILMARWLQTFAYHTSLSWWIFVLGGLIALAISVLTVGYQAYRAASQDPVNSLRYE
jgi:ABC-type antimicrobial peptide transport system permease subunit